MAKSDSVFICNNCGAEFTKWMGQCSSCSEWGGLTEEVKVKVGGAYKDEEIRAKKISEVVKEVVERVTSGFEEFDRVLGQTGGKFGFVGGQVVLLSGEPGVGKSTLLLQLLSKHAKNGFDSVYVSAEESESQVAQRAARLLGETDKIMNSEKLKLVSAHNVEAILALLEKIKPHFVVVDSIQTVFSSDSSSLPGSVSQVKVSSHRLINYAKRNNITMIIVGHINKEGVIAGPKILEHLVDSVFQLEGNDISDVRMMRSLKNRFGPTMEVGMFQMTGMGLIDLSDPSSILDVSHGGNSIGVCRSVIVEGQRPLIVEVQALTSATPFSLPKRVSEGIPVPRLQRIAAILSRYAKISFSDKDIYIKVAGGIKVVDPGLDLAIALAIISSSKNKMLADRTVAIGELNLTGGISSVPRLEDRVKEASRMGYKNVISGNKVPSIGGLIRGSIFA